MLEGVTVLENENNNGNRVSICHQGVIQSSSGRVLGYVSPNGFLYDHKHDLLGYVSTYGNVRDVQLRLLGHVNLHQHSFPYEAGSVAFFLFQKTTEI